MEEIIVKKNQKMVLPILWTGKEDEIHYSVRLAEVGASIKIVGLLLGNNSQSLNSYITVIHEAPQTKSEVVLKGALQDTAKINFEGLVKIEKGAKGTHAWLAAHLLLLSDKAKGRAIPSLEISENDIKAGHATTVGRVSALELFYLMSRGLSEQQAKSLIVEGFLRSVIKNFPKEFSLSTEKSLKKFVV